MIVFIYAGILGLILFKLSIDTIAQRRKHQISLGVGENAEINNIVSAHANFVAYAPILILLLAAVEYSNIFPSIIIHLLGVIITAGRIFHFYAFKGKMSFGPRKIGMHMTLWPLLILSGVVTYTGIRSLF